MDRLLCIFLRVLTTHSMSSAAGTAAVFSPDRIAEDSDWYMRRCQSASSASLETAARLRSGVRCCTLELGRAGPLLPSGPRLVPVPGPAGTESEVGAPTDAREARAALTARSAEGSVGWLPEEEEEEEEEEVELV